MLVWVPLKASMGPSPQKHIDRFKIKFLCHARGSTYQKKLKCYIVWCECVAQGQMRTIVFYPRHL